MQFKPHATEECTAGACSLWLHGGNTLRGWWREKKRRRKKEKMIKGKKKVSLLHNWHFLLRVQILRLWPPVGVSWCSMHRRTCCRSILQAMHIADLSSPFKLKEKENETSTKQQNQYFIVSSQQTIHRIRSPKKSGNAGLRLLNVRVGRRFPLFNVRHCFIPI